MTGATRWNDLAPRLTSALVMLGVGGVALALGGLWLRGLLALVCGAMIWEVIGLFAPHEGRRALAFAAATAVAFFVATWLPISAAAIVMLLAIVLIYKCLPVKGGLLPAYGALVSAGAMGVFGLYIQSGLSAVIWLISLVIITDLAGYFAGRLLGGPKFWAAISLGLEPSRGGLEQDALEAFLSGSLRGFIGVLYLSASFFPSCRSLVIFLKVTSNVVPVSKTALL